MVPYAIMRNQKTKPTLGFPAGNRPLIPVRVLAEAPGRTGARCRPKPAAVRELASIRGVSD